MGFIADQDLSVTTNDVDCVFVALATVPDSWIHDTIQALSTIESTIDGYLIIVEYYQANISIAGAKAALQAAGAKKAAAAIAGVQGAVSDATSAADAVVSQMNVIEAPLANLCPFLGKINLISENMIGDLTYDVKRMMSLTFRIDTVVKKYDKTIQTLREYLSYIARLRGAMQDVLSLRNSVSTVGSIRRY